MDIDLLHRFTTAPSFFLNACLVAGEPDKLGALYKYTPSGAPQHTYLTALAVFDIQRHTPLSTTTYTEHGPQNEQLTDALLGYDAAQKRWIIAERLSWTYIVLRTTTAGNNNDVTLSPPCLLDRDQFSDSGFPPLLDLECLEEKYRLIYHKPSEEEHRTAAVVLKQDFVCQPGWDMLHEQACAVQLQDTRSLSWQQWLELTRQLQTLPTGHRLINRVLLPVQVLVDPGTTNASQTAELELINRMEVAEAENAMTIADQHTRLLVLCAPETWVVPDEQPRAATEIERTGEQWRIWLTSWDRAELTYQWTYAPDIGLPADPDIPDYKIPKSPTVEIAAIAGPDTTNKQPTFVVTMAMQGTEELLSRGVCLTHDGQVVQVCDEALGRAPSLGLCQHTVIGVDRLATGWRLWNWRVLDEAHLRTRLPLDARCQRAAVCPQSQTGLFWLIEELPDGVRVSLRDAQTLGEVEPMGFIAEARLLESPGDRPLESHRIAGLLPYDQTLLLLLRGTQEELLLYQVR